MFGFILKQILIYVVVIGGLGFAFYTYGKNKGVVPAKYLGLCMCGVAALMFLSGLLTAINGALFW